MSTAASGSDAAASGKIGDSIILEEEIDPNYEPSQDEVVEKVFPELCTACGLIRFLFAAIFGMAAAVPAASAAAACSPAGEHLSRQAEHNNGCQHIVQSLTFTARA